MSIRVLNIVNSAYRATLEEQDDPVLWIVAAMRGAGAGADVLLRGNAVNYGVKGQDAAGLKLGDWSQTHPPDLPRDLKKLVDGGAAVFFVQEDAAARGIEPADLIEGLSPIDRAGLATLIDTYPAVWNW